MKRFSTYLLTIVWAIFIQSCIPPSTDQIEKITTPDNTKMTDFGIQVNGQIIYQFYQKYGFTDLEEQLIMVVRPDNLDDLTTDLPFDSLDMKRVGKIDLRKFIKDKPVIFAPEKTLQADIRLESKEYTSGQAQFVSYRTGKYRLTQTDTTETILVYDSQAGLLYVESKKTN